MEDFKDGQEDGRKIGKLVTWHKVSKMIEAGKSLEEIKKLADERVIELDKQL